MRARALPGLALWSAIALATVSVGLAAGPLPWRFLGESGLPAPAPRAPDAAPAEAVALGPILALAPFGRLSEPEPAAPQAETALGLTLHGVLIAGRPGASSAIISAQAEPARAVTVGQAVGGATLVAVESDRVILAVGDRRETLSFPDTRRAASETGGDRGVQALQALVTGGGVPAARSGATGAAPAAPAATGPDAMIADYRARIRANPKTVLDGLGLAASEAGYRVTEGAPPMLRRAGLRPGDVVATVNGQQVGDVETDRALFDDVAASGRARIEVLRDGQRVVLSFPLR